MIRDPIFLVATNMFAAVLLRMVKPNLLSALILAVVMIASTFYLGSHHSQEIMGSIYSARDYALTHIGRPSSWPPEKLRKFPAVELVDQDGNLTKLSEFQGKVILVEPVGMSCPGCVAFSGGGTFGPFRGSVSQPGLSSIEEYVRQYGNVDLNHPDIVFVQILLFNQQMEVPTQEEVAAWAKHFRMSRAKNRVVLGGTPELLTEASHALIPGFQLVDRNLVLKFDSTGHQPKDDLYTKLIPAIQELLDEE